MENVTAVEELKSEIRRRLADATLTVDAPSSSDGSWWLDVQRYGRVASVEWRPGKGFGIAAPGGAYGEGVDFVVDDAVAAAEHLSRQLQNGNSEVEAVLAGVETELRELRSRVVTMEHELAEMANRTSRDR